MRFVEVRYKCQCMKQEAAVQNWSEAMMLQCTGCGSRDSIEEIRRKHPDALSCCPERSMAPVVVYLREQDAGTDNACWMLCAKGDPGAVLFIAHEGR